MYLKKIFLTAPLCLFLAAGCSTAPEVVVKGGPVSQTITARQGKTFSVQLESQMSTGYSWKLAEIPSSVTLEKESVITESKQIAGGIDIQEFIFKAVAKGDLLLTFRYGEHWKEKPRYIKTSEVKVKIE